MPQTRSRAEWSEQVRRAMLSTHACTRSHAARKYITREESISISLDRFYASKVVASFLGRHKSVRFKCLLPDCTRKIMIAMHPDKSQEEDAYLQERERQEKKNNSHYKRSTHTLSVVQMYTRL